jgi:hypothetical protein
MGTAKKIPDLPPEELEKMFARIRPVMRFSSGKNGLIPSEWGDLYFVRVDNPQEIITKNLLPGSRAHRIGVLTTVTTYHRWIAFTPEVEPTCAEVYAKIRELDEDVADYVVAFEVDTRNVHQGHIEGDYIKAQTKLYMRCGRNGNRKRS